MNLLISPMNKELEITEIKKSRRFGHGFCGGDSANLDCTCCTQSKQGETNHQYRHLSNLGFVENARVTVVNECGGNLIVKVKGSTVAIGKGIAKRIYVKIVEEV